MVGKKLLCSVFCEQFCRKSQLWLELVGLEGLCPSAASTYEGLPKQVALGEAPSVRSIINPLKVPEIPPGMV